MTDIDAALAILLTPDGKGKKKKAEVLSELCITTSPNLVRDRIKQFINKSSQHLKIYKKPPILKTMSEIHRIGVVTRGQVVETLKQSTDTKADAFVHTFIGKADKQDMWDKCKGVFNPEGELMAIIITTITKRVPRSANLQLMHTFAKHRKKGIGKLLVDDAIDQALMADCEYFRVSAERTAVGFYAKCGIPFLGMQKSGTFLALFSLSGPRERITSFIQDKALRKNGRIWLSRCENPTEREKQTVQQLGDKYIFNSLMTWQPSVSS